VDPDAIKGLVAAIVVAAGAVLLRIWRHRHGRNGN
jgi:hypothetical protein